MDSSQKAVIMLGYRSRISFGDRYGIEPVLLDCSNLDGKCVVFEQFELEENMAVSRAQVLLKKRDKSSAILRLDTRENGLLD